MPRIYGDPRAALDRLTILLPGKQGASSQASSEKRVENHLGDHVARALSFSEARNLMDWLEANGVNQREIVLDPSGTITVSWRI